MNSQDRVVLDKLDRLQRLAYLAANGLPMTAGDRRELAKQCGVVSAQEAFGVAIGLTIALSLFQIAEVDRELVKAIGHCPC